MRPFSFPWKLISTTELACQTLEMSFHGRRRPGGEDVERWVNRGFSVIKNELSCVVVVDQDVHNTLILVDRKAVLLSKLIADNISLIDNVSTSFEGRTLLTDTVSHTITHMDESALQELVFNETRPGE